MDVFQRYVDQDDSAKERYRKATGPGVQDTRTQHTLRIDLLVNANNEKTQEESRSALCLGPSIRFLYPAPWESEKEGEPDATSLALSIASSIGSYFGLDDVKKPRKALFPRFTKRSSSLQSDHCVSPLQLNVDCSCLSSPEQILAHTSASPLVGDTNPRQTHVPPVGPTPRMREATLVRAQIFEPKVDEYVSFQSLEPAIFPPSTDSIVLGLGLNLGDEGCSGQSKDILNRLAPSTSTPQLAALLSTHRLSRIFDQLSN